MSIASAFANASSGLAASARAVQVASANIANSLTEGYAPRALDLAPAGTAGSGGGVRITGITRLTDPVLIDLSRQTAASAAAGTRSSGFWQRVETALGAPGEGLSRALGDFGGALISASARPDLDSRLAAVLDSAQTVATGLNRAQANVQSLRAEADKAIARDVQVLNDGLARIDTLNENIIRLQASAQSTLGLMDERQALISSLSEIVPMREYPRPDGRITLFSTGGELLLDIEPALFEFAPTAAINPVMSVGSGLSALTIRGRTVSMAEGGALSGGRLAANFHVRDVDAPQVQAELDACAADLVNRFSDTATDATLPPGSPGLFTDAGGLVSATVGLAGRLAVNDAVRPAAGGALWRLRDGIGAAGPGAVGDGTGLRALMAALDRPTAAGPGAPARTASGVLGDLLAYVSSARQGAEDRATIDSARHEELTGQLLAQGVDTDAEMQRLLVIEQAYAANARVIETADAMLRRLLEI